MDMNIPYLCDEMVSDILSRLPTPYLCRWKCVSKQWRNVLVPRILTQRKDSKESIAFVGSAGMTGKPFFFSLSELNDSIQYDRYSSSSMVQDTILDVCNGATLCSLRLSSSIDPNPIGLSYITKYAIYNPFTCETSIIDPPHTNSRWMDNGFVFLAFDSRLSQNFKFVCMKGVNKPFVYSSKTKEWQSLELSKSLQNLVPYYWLDRWRGSYCMNGIAYKIIYGSLYGDFREKILVFDMEQDSLWMIASPVSVKEALQIYSFGESAGHLCFLQFCTKRFSLKIWVLQDCRLSQWNLKHDIYFEKDQIFFFNFHPLLEEAIFLTNCKGVTFLYDLKRLGHREVLKLDRIRELKFLYVYSRF